jgi:hypothetical protein
MTLSALLHVGNYVGVRVHRHGDARDGRLAGEVSSALGRRAASHLEQGVFAQGESPELDAFFSGLSLLRFSI